MNKDCWGHTATFLCLRDLLNARYLNTNIHSALNFEYDKRKRPIIFKRVLNQLISKRALRDWIHRSPLLCCLTEVKMTSRFGQCNRIWDPPLGWYTHKLRYNRNCITLNENNWGRGRHINHRFRGWNRRICENRIKLMRHKDNIYNVTSRARDRIYRKRWCNYV